MARPRRDGYRRQYGAAYGSHYSRTSPREVRPAVHLFSRLPGPPRSLDIFVAMFGASRPSTEELQTLLARFQNPDKEGPVLVKPLKKGWSKRYLILMKEFLYIFDEKPSLASKELKEGPSTIPLVDASITMEDGQEKKHCFLLQTPAKEYLVAADSDEASAAWRDALRKHIALAVELSKTLTPDQEKALVKMNELVVKEAHAPDREEMVRFLRSVEFDAARAALLYTYNLTWRSQLGISRLTVAHVAKQIRQNKAILPGILDKKGRPAIVARARCHDPNVDFIETLTLLVYLFEKALRETKAEEVVLIYDLNGFEKANADNRGMKFLLEAFQSHYPGRVAVAYVVNSPFFYRLLWKLVKPWLSGDLMSKVTMLSSHEGLWPHFTKQNLLPEHGGTAQYSTERWLEETAAKEGVQLPPPGQNAPHPVSGELAGLLQEISAVDCERGALKTGWLKKQGGVIKQYNKRFCVIRGNVFYYFYEKTDKRAEGAIPLTRATLEDGRRGERDSTFHVVSYVQKDCVFDGDSPASDCEQLKKEWMTALAQAIRDASQTHP